MALLDGMLAGAQSAMAFGQQQTENKLAKARFEEQKRQYDQSYDESVRQFNITNTLAQNQEKRQQETHDREISVQVADDHYSILDMGGYIAADRKSLNWEKIKKFELLSKEFAIDAGEMTPKLSLKRTVILQKYEALILKIYDYKNTSL